MCLQIYLLSDQVLSPDLESDEYPGLTLVREDGIGQNSVRWRLLRFRRFAAVYRVSPGDYCGCYFGHETREELDRLLEQRGEQPHESAPFSVEQLETMWQCRFDAVRSFGRFLDEFQNAGLALYTVWEGREGAIEPLRREVPPSYFNSPGFAALPEDCLLTIVPEFGPDDLDPPWPTDVAIRTHEWMTLRPDDEFE